MTDELLAALLRPDAPDVFHAVAHKGDVFRHDPFDVETIHAPAREAFDSALESAQGERRKDHGGRILLILGESGSGKTHLMRAFRNRVHGRGKGFVAYAQMTSTASNYTRFLLRNVLESLDKPYEPLGSPRTALMRISDQVCALEGVCTDSELKTLRSTDDATELRKTVWRVGNRAVNGPLADTGPGIDPEFVHQILYLQRGIPTIAKAALRFLACERLSERERRLLGNISSRTLEEDPEIFLRSLGQLIRAVDDSAFVLCVDQLEDAYADDEATSRKVRRTFTALRELTDSCPNVIVVVACLEDYWAVIRNTVARSILDRMVLDPEPVRLEAVLDSEAVRDLIAARLAVVLEHADTPVDAANPIAPFDLGGLDRLAAMRTRDVLENCRRLAEMARQRREAPRFAWLDDMAASDQGFPATHQTVVPTRAQAAPDPATPSTPRAAAPVDLTVWSQRWDDFRAEFEAEIPEDETELAAILARTLGDAAAEVGPRARIQARADGSRVVVRAAGVREFTPRVLGVCDKAARGGGLAKQIEQLVEMAGDTKVGVVRTAMFPTDPRTKIVRYLGRLVADGHTRSECTPSQWKAFLAMAEFAQEHGGAAGFAAWRREERPILSQQSIVDLLDAGRWAPEADEAVASPAAADEPGPALEPAPEPAAASAPPTPAPSPPPAAGTPAPASAAPDPANTPIRLGAAVGVRPDPVHLDPDDLTRHAAVLGGSGSGKTTLALSILEQAAEREVSAILVDRKGDLAVYADPSRWDAELAALAPAARARAERLRATVEVHLYTPGDDRGRDLAVPVLPPPTQRLAPREREQLIQHYAAALAGMLVGSRQEQQRRLAILKSALEVLELYRAPGPAEDGGAPAVPVKDDVQVADVIELLGGPGGPDPTLLQTVGQIPGKALEKLAQDLQVVQLTQPILRPSPGAELLDAGALLGGYPGEGRTRLSILNLSQLGDLENVLFFVTHLFTGLARFAAKNPCDGLQGLVFLDEADVFLPAKKSPPTKDPIENALRRFRSAGLGVLLATQSPGDLDYRCRENVHTWLLGKVTQDTALKKLAPLFGPHPDAVKHLAGQSQGRFQSVQDGRASAFAADRSLLATQQLEPQRILDLARATRDRHGTAHRG